ncbi:Fic family protein [Candidatus Pacearchaeota archaeon]|nr:Fic family protein [Candidatus Pacearchaeota archaeon]
MPTRYDVFTKIIEKSPCKPKDLNFKVPVYVHIDSLEKDGWVRKTKEGVLIPVSTKRSKDAFEIIKWSLKNGINPNIWFSKNIEKILETLAKKAPKINPKKLSSNSKNVEIIDFLTNNQFILIYKKNPKLGTLLNHKMFELLQNYFDKKFEIKEKYLPLEKIRELVAKTKKREINPFGLKLFEFLAGSAQLEGGTVTIGETVEILTKDIYPDKPSKDIQMVKNLNEAFSYVLEHLDEDINLDHIKELNKISLFSLHKGAGQFKKSHNKIAGNPNFKTASPKEVNSLLINFCEKFNSIKSRENALQELGFIHNQFQYIHPFSDGNSRTTRLIINWYLMKFRFPILILKKGAFEKYMLLTKMSRKRNDRNLVSFLLHVIYHEELAKND